MNKLLLGAIIIIILGMSPTKAMAQIGEHRNDLAIGFGGGYTLSNVGFTPEIPQKMLGGCTFGLAIRYTCEKYFKSVCSIMAELNITQMGWKEDILTSEDYPVINEYTGVAEKLSRKITYVQLPLMARMNWGRERKGAAGFFQVGPQAGYYLSDKITSNFDLDQRNISERVGALQEAPNDSMSIENKFDYGIVGGAGLEISTKKAGHFILEARYYYGLGDIFNNSKSDYFGRSNNNSIIIRFTWLFDIIRTKDNNIK